MSVKELLKEYTYSEIEDIDKEEGTNYTQEVVNYEKEKYVPKIDKYVDSGKTKEWLHNKTHEWWLNYECSDGTEDALDKYIDSLKIA